MSNPLKLFAIVSIVSSVVYGISHAQVPDIASSTPPVNTSSTTAPDLTTVSTTSTSSPSVETSSSTIPNITISISTSTATTTVETATTTSTTTISNQNNSTSTVEATSSTATTSPNIDIAASSTATTTLDVNLGDQNISSSTEATTTQIIATTTDKIATSTIKFATYTWDRARNKNIQNIKKFSPLPKLKQKHESNLTVKTKTLESNTVQKNKQNFLTKKLDLLDQSGQVPSSDINTLRNEIATPDVIQFATKSGSSAVLGNVTGSTNIISSKISFLLTITHTTPFVQNNLHFGTSTLVVNSNLSNYTAPLDVIHSVVTATTYQQLNDIRKQIYADASKAH